MTACQSVCRTVADVDFCALCARQQSEGGWGANRCSFRARRFLSFQRCHEPEQEQAAHDSDDEQDRARAVLPGCRGRPAQSTALITHPSSPCIAGYDEALCWPLSRTAHTKSCLYDQGLTIMLRVAFARCSSGVRHSLHCSTPLRRVKAMQLVTHNAHQKCAAVGNVTQQQLMHALSPFSTTPVVAAIIRMPECP